MNTEPTAHDRSLIPRNQLPRPGIATQQQTPLVRRNLAFWSSFALAPVAIGVGLAALRSRRAGLIAGGLTALGFGLVRFQLQRLFTAEPAYEVEQRIGALEVRRYEPRVEARSRIAGTDFEGALDEGFDRLAGYIFGGNTAEEKLAMTTPVINRGEQRATTASGEAGEQVMAFVMPKDRALASLPRPEDARVELVEVPARRVVVLRFAGRYDNELVAEKQGELRRLVAAAGLPVKGEPMFAGFDPPTTLGSLRRNEIWIELS
ncbi:MAG: heme-binding protein [Myxococcota bacterium]|nr:heme-binding protein [Myxococcota bacterium]